MSKVVPLDNIAHADLRLRTGYGAAFGHGVNQIAVLPAEFASAQRDCPILFRRDDDGWQALAILGLERDSNLFLSGDDWNARYIPALARTGPFRLGGEQDGDVVVSIDLDHPRVAAPDDDRSAPLFLEHGGQAPALAAALVALRIAHAGTAELARMSALFDALGLPEQVDLTVTRANGQQVRFDGYSAIGEDRLAALSPEQLGELNAAHMLGPLFHAAASIANFNTLLALDAQSG